MIKIENYRQLHDTDNKEQGICIIGTCLSTDEKPKEYAGGSILIETDHDGGFWVWMFDEASMEWILQTTFFDGSSIKCDCPTVEDVTSQVVSRIPVASHTKLGIMQADKAGLKLKNGILYLDYEYLMGWIRSEIVDPTVEKMKEHIETRLSETKKELEEAFEGKLSELKQYVDEQDEKTLTAAKEYTDEQIAGLNG